MRFHPPPAALGLLVCVIGAACTHQQPETTVVHLDPVPVSAEANDEPLEDPTAEPQVEKARKARPTGDGDEDVDAAGTTGTRNDTARARDLFRTGADAYAQGDYLRARDLFQEAYDLVQEPALLFNIASCELRMGDVVGACGHFRKYVSQGSPGNPRIQQVQAQVAQRCKSVP